MPNHDTARSGRLDESQLSRESIAVLQILAESTAPRGARLIAGELHDAGHSVSEPTVSRILTRLDESGLTSAVGAKGRVLTDHGRMLINEINRNKSRGEELSGALDIQHIDQLIDLLRARRGLEREVVLLAAERATEQDFADLEAALDDHRHMVAGESYHGYVANRFHKLLVGCSRSGLFETLSSVVLYDALDALDPLLLVVTSLRGSVTDAPNEHRALLEALRQRDGERAQAILDHHLTRLIAEVEDFKLRNGEGVFANLLTLTHAPAGG